MSASAIANKIQYQDAFANKRQVRQQEGGALNSHPSTEPKSDIDINKVRLEDPLRQDDNDSGYLPNATYKSDDYKSDHRDALDNKSIYSTPIGKSQVENTAADTPLPASIKKSGDAPSKDSDDYDKVVKVIHDHISKELPKLRESKSVEGQKQSTECCCGHKAKESAAAQAEEKEQNSAEEKAVAGESEGSGEEEKDEGDDTVIVTLRATEPVEDKAEHVGEKTTEENKKE